MPISFPSSPSLNQIYTSGPKTWKWNGYAWDLQGGVTSSVAPPVSPKTGDQWYKTDTGVLYEYISDGTTSNWIDISSSTVTSSTNLLSGITLSTGKAIAISIVFGGGW